MSDDLHGLGVRPMNGWKRPVYRPTWWERRFPWLLDVMAGMDPEPLGVAIGRFLVPVRARIEATTVPLAAVLDRAGEARRRGWTAASEALGRTVRRLPMPGMLRDALWLRPDWRVGADGLTAQEVLRRQYRAAVPAALVAAVVIHVGAFVLWPGLTVPRLPVADEAMEAINIPPAIEVPPPPPELPRPALPILAATEISDDVTIAPTTFDDNPVRALAPPPERVADASAGGTGFSPYTVAPRLLNQEEVAELIRRSYPPALRNAGVGGRTVVEFHVGEDGRVRTVRLVQSAGHPDLDQAALDVADQLRFAPGLNIDRHVAVWVKIALEFRVRGAG